MKLRSEMHEGFKLCPLFARLRREMSSPSPCLNLYFQTLLGTDMGIPLIRTGGTSENFKKDPIALLNHNPDFPIGRWTNTRVENNQLLGHLQLAPEGTSARIDEVRKLIFARVLCSCSVGFVPLEQELSGKGISFKRQRLLECSVVSIPSNASAQWVEAKKIEARHLGINSDSIDRIFRQNKNATLAERQANAKRVLALSRAKATLARTAHLAKPKPAPATSRSYPFLT